MDTGRFLETSFLVFASVQEKTFDQSQRLANLINVERHKPKQNMKSYQLIETILIALFSSLLTALVTALAMHIFFVAPLLKKAVDNGYAQWKVIDNATGRTSFTWNDPIPQDTLEQIESIDLTKAEY